MWTVSDAGRPQVRSGKHVHRAARMSEKRHGSVPLRPCMQKQLWAFGLHVSSLLSRAHDLQPSGLKDCVMSPFTWKHQQSCATSQPGVNGTCVEQGRREGGHGGCGGCDDDGDGGTQWSSARPERGAVGKM